MSVSIKVPDLGAADDNVTIARWLVDEGASITRGQKIVAIETDKAVVELESVATGVLLKKCAADGDDAVVGDTIAIIGKAGELVESTDAVGSKPSRTEAGAGSGQKATNGPSTGGSHGHQKPRISPMVRNLARQQGVDLDQLVGTGPGGLITRQDVLSAVKRVGE